MLNIKEECPPLLKKTAKILLLLTGMKPDFLCMLYQNNILLTDWKQKQMWESSCFLLSHTLKNCVKHVKQSKNCSFSYFKMQLFFIKNIIVFSAFICCSIAQSYPTLWNSMDCSMSGFPVLHHLSEVAQTYVHWVGNVIQPSHLLSSPSPPTFNLSQNQSFLMSWLFAPGGQSTGASASASIPPMNIRDWFPLGWTGWSPCSPRDSQESSPTPQFKSINSLVLSLLYGQTLTSMTLLRLF